MQPGFIIRAMWRRKLLSAVGLLLTIGMAVGAAVAVGPSYTAEAIVVLIPPQPDQGVKNPYLYLAGLNQARDIVERSLGSEEVQARLKKADAKATYTVTEDPMSAGPLLVITADAPTTDQVTKTLDALLASVGPTTKRLQDQLHISPSAQIKTLKVTEDVKPTAVHKSQMRIGIMAVALGLGLSLLVVALVDGLLTRGRKRQASGDTADAQPDRPAAGPQPPARGPARDERPPARKPQPGRAPGAPGNGAPPRREPARPDGQPRPDKTQNGARPGHPQARPVRPPRPNDRNGAVGARGETRA